MTQKATTQVPDVQYWEARAEQELTLAAAAEDSRVVATHYEMLGRYLEQLYPSKRPPADARPGR